MFFVFSQLTVSNIIKLLVTDLPISSSSFNISRKQRYEHIPAYSFIKYNKLHTITQCSNALLLHLHIYICIRYMYKVTKFLSKAFGCGSWRERHLVTPSFSQTALYSLNTVSAMQFCYQGIVRVHTMQML